MMRILTDGQMIDWLQDQQVDTIYLDDGRIIDVKSGNLRDALDNAHQNACERAHEQSLGDAWEGGFAANH